MSEKWKCRKCGYVYDPEFGDAGAGISPGTSFEDLPSDWKCPRCGADKKHFAKKED